MNSFADPYSVIAPAEGANLLSMSLLPRTVSYVGPRAQTTYAS
jgi:hypothetical protein